VPFVLYDIAPQTLAPDPASLTRAVQAGATVVVIAHLYGIPVDLNAVRGIVGPDVLIVDDAAQGVGALLEGSALGSFGALGVLSFGRGKGMTGGGGGALVVPRNSPLAREVAALDLPAANAAAATSLLKSLAQWALGRPRAYAVPLALPFLGLGETPYRAPHTSRRISAFSCGVLVRSIGLAAAETAARAANALAYSDSLAGTAIRTPRAPEHAVPGWLRYPILLPQAPSSEVAVTAARRSGVVPGYPRPLARLERFGERRINAGDQFPGAQELADQLFTLPTHRSVGASDRSAIIARVRALAGER
jgi:dTDP-4-amino-4,6-dideoxygalactose transaminase